MLQCKNGMVEQIFAATERLMAKNGFHQLSMHKIAKEAQISPGTIYIYFKSKEELLERLAHYVFERIDYTVRHNYNSELSLSEQYRQMWWNLWHLLHDNPNLVLNMHQYQVLPGFEALLQEYKTDENNAWRLFCQQARQANVLCDMSDDILFSLSLESAINLAFKSVSYKEEFDITLLESVIQRTWHCIQKNI